MSEINIRGHTFAVYFSKRDVNGFYTKNETKKRKITELTIRIGKYQNPRIDYTKIWSPLYKTTISWDNSDSEVWDLIILLEQLEGIKFKIQDKSPNHIDVFHRFPDNVSSTIFRTIERMSYNSSGNEYTTGYGYGDENYKYFKTETVIEKW